MIQAATFLFSGLFLGLAAGMTPGPLLMLVISETLKYNRREGLKVAAAPLVTDAPIILVTTYIIIGFSDLNLILAVIAFCGALFLAYLAYESISISMDNVELSIKSKKMRSFKKGVIAQALSPYPYLFWLAVGTPTLLKAYDMSIMATILFILGFYTTFIGAKVIVAFLTEKSRVFLKSKAYVYTIKILGFALLLFAVIFIKEGLTLLGVI